MTTASKREGESVKSVRQAVIKNIIESQIIETQEDLADALRQQRIQSVAQPAPGVVRPDTSITWHVGDKARHRKWGVGTVVSVKGTGEEVELKIAFPGQGVKGLMQKYAPIEKV